MGASDLGRRSSHHRTRAPGPLLAYGSVQLGLRDSFSAGRCGAARRTSHSSVPAPPRAAGRTALRAPAAEGACRQLRATGEPRRTRYMGRGRTRPSTDRAVRARTVLPPGTAPAPTMNRDTAIGLLDQLHEAQNELSRPARVLRVSSSSLRTSRARIRPGRIARVEPPLARGGCRSQSVPARRRRRSPRNGVKQNTTIRPGAGRRSAHDADA
jgi:hypothetical protein